MNALTARFIDDMRTAGLAIRPYAGRFFWKGPAVAVDNLQTAMSATKVPVMWDQLGRGYIVYPVDSDDAWYEMNGTADVPVD